MKKLISTVLILCFCLGIYSCSKKDEVDPEEGTKALKKAMEKVKLSGVSFTDTNLENILPEEVTEKIEEIKEEGSLLDKVEKPTNNSLLNRGK